MENTATQHILYVEDDPAHAAFTLRYFKKNTTGYKIIHLSDGHEALDYLFCRGKYEDLKSLPDLILLDLRLPKVDGLEVLKSIKKDKKLRCIPTIIFTTSEAEIDIAKAYQFYVNSYLVKPLDTSKFSEMMDSLKYYWMVWNKSMSI